LINSLGAWLDSLGIEWAWQSQYSSTVYPSTQSRDLLIADADEFSTLMSKCLIPKWNKQIEMNKMLGGDDLPISGDEWKNE
jgi:hypothetical protein